MLDIKKLSGKLKTTIVSLSKLEIEFDLIGFDPAIVNALRRILISDVPSMAIEKIHMYQNTSIMQVILDCDWLTHTQYSHLIGHSQDEVLSHRLGLLPLTGAAMVNC